MEKKKQRPLLLLRNVRYSTYQLWAIAGNANNKTNVLKIAVLQTLQWLRERFREQELPHELNFPTADAFKDVELSQFTSVTLRYGYKLEIVWLADDNCWTMQLTEPDLGSSPGTIGEGVRVPVAGRIFETNISYQITGEGVLCGFQTIVSEPEGTQEACEVYRLGVIKHLKRNPLVGLTHLWKLEEEPHFIRSIKDVKIFQKGLNTKKRTLPIVLIAEYMSPKNNSQKQNHIIEFNISNPPPSLDSMLKQNSYLPSSAEIPMHNEAESPEQESFPLLPHWIQEISHNRMGYAAFLCCSSRNYA